MPLTPEVLQEGLAHFADHCATCHANDGSGRTPIGTGVYPKAPEFLKGTKITFNADEVKGQRAKVKSTVQNKADLTDVDYELANEGQKGWLVTDVSISGQSWVESIRDEVAKVLKKNKWAGLKQKMTKRLNELKSGKS